MNYALALGTLCFLISMVAEYPFDMAFWVVGLVCSLKGWIFDDCTIEDDLSDQSLED